ncbi:MAG: helix-turn-helix domain-containing protein [Succinivibrio sp.]
MKNKELIHESKIHGTEFFQYSIYHSLIPCTMVSYPMHWHKEIELVYVKKGTVRYLVGRKEYIVSEGDIIIINSQMPHSVEQYEHESAEFFPFLFDFEVIRRYAGEGPYQRYASDFAALSLKVKTLHKKSTPLNDLLTPLMLALIERRKQIYDGFECGAIASILLIMQYLYEYSVKTDKQQDLYVSEFSRIKPAIYEVQSRSEQKLSLRMMADICHLSRSQFCRLFKNITGKPFNAYLIDYRLENARKMLSSKDRLIDIALECGFENQSYFTRKFVSKYKLTPSEYRKKLTESGSSEKENTEREA